MTFVVAIDGPSGTGKGTVTKAIAEHMGLINIDTGATYRCVTLAMLKNNIKLTELDKIEKILNEIQIEFKHIDGVQRVFLNSEDVTEIIRGKQVTENVSQVSAIKKVRFKMVNLQRKLSENKAVIMEGRDIGTYVFPNADIKIYLDADEQERANRRYKQNMENGIDMTYEEVLENIKSRDKRDKEKEMGALKIADDAIVIDTTNMTQDEVVKKIENLIRKGDKFCKSL